MSIRLKPVADQVIVITGATSGIGLATAPEAARRGASVMLASRDELDLQTVASELRAGGAHVAHFAVDVGDQDGVLELAEVAIAEFGRIDTWINNAGTSIYGRLEVIPVEDAERMFRTNYWGVVHGSLAALPFLKENGGALINLGSEVSETAIPLQGHYVASKHAVKGFTDTLRMELHEEDAPVSVTLIQPAAIDTQFLDHSKTYLGVVPNHLPPVYDAQIVADAILDCAETPRRNLRVGGAAKMFTMIEKTVPGLGDSLKERVAFEGSKTDMPKDSDDDTLWAPRAGDVSESGSYEGHVMKRSLYTTGALHPMAALLGAAVIGVGIAAVMSRRGD